MLKQIKLNANQVTTIARQGKHINVVLAAGTVTARIQYVSGTVYETDLVSGMAFETEQPFQSVGFSSETAQQMQVWLSDIPLNYSPIDSRLVGSSALESFTAQAFSGEAYELLPAKAGRNKVTISPADDILIGGVGVSAKTGIPVPAGSVFEFATQGAVYALETSGAYPVQITADFTADDIANPRTETITANRTGFIPRLNDTEIVLFTAGQATAYRHLVSDLSLVTTAALPVAPLGYNVFELNGIAHYTGKISNQNYWVEVDLSTMATTSEAFSVALAGAYAEHFDVFGTKRVAMESGASGYLYYSIDGGAWSTESVVDPNQGTTYGVAINSAGHVYVLHATTISKTTDNGATWSTIGLAANAKGEHGLSIDTLTDDIYYITTTGTLNKSIDDGATWTSELTAGALENIYCRGGTFVAAGDDLYHIYTAALGWTTYDVTPNVQQRGFGLSTDGRVYMGYTTTLYIVEGEIIQSGGLEVAIMAEVN